MIFLELVVFFIIGAAYVMCLWNLDLYVYVGNNRLAWLWGVLAAVQVGLLVLLVTV